MDQRLAQIMCRPARPSSHRACAECITRERAHSRACAWTRAGTPLPSPWDLRSAARVRRSQESGAVAAAAAPFTAAAAAKLRPGPGPARARARAGLSVWVLATHLGAVAPTYHALLVARVLSGVGEASFQAAPLPPPPPPTHAWPKGPAPPSRPLRPCPPAPPPPCLRPRVAWPNPCAPPSPAGPCPAPPDAPGRQG